MLYFILFFLLADLISFLGLSIFNLESAILLKQVSLIIIVTISLSSFLKNKIVKLEIIYLIYVIFLTFFSIQTVNVPSIIIYQSSYLLLFPLFFVKLGNKFSSIENLSKFEKFIQYFAISNFIFMLFEINNTEFLIQIGLSEFWINVKGVVQGININSNLPFNYHTDFEATTRRGAGLLLAPLASGMLHAFASYISFVKFVNYKSRSDLFLLIIIFIGLILTNSRGPMIFLFISIFIYFLKNKEKLKINIGERFFWFLMILGVAYVAVPTIIDAITLKDERAPGHYFSLINNIINLPSIPIFGYGIGTQGSLSAEAGISVLGQGFGTEGGIFSTTYQCGIIFGVIFLIWYFNLTKEDQFANDKRAYPLLISGIVIMLTSEHFYTISGYVYIWYYIGLSKKKNESFTNL